MFRSLRFKIVVTLILINTASFMLMNFITYETSNKQMNNQLIHHSLTNLKSSVTNLNSSLALQLKEAELISKIPPRLQTTEQKLIFLRNEVPLANHLKTRHIGIGNFGGDVKLLDGTTIPMRDNIAYQQALNGKTSYSNVILDAQGVPVLWIMVPHYDENNVIQGVIGMALDSMKVFGDQFRMHSSDYKDSAIILIDRETNLLYYDDVTLILKRNYIKDEPALLEFAEKLRNSEEGYGEESVFGQVLKLFYVKVPETNWYAVLSVSKEEFEAPMRKSLWLNMGLIALAEIVLGTLLYLITQRSILNRLKHVVEVTKNVAAGNFYPTPLRVRSHDEMGILALSVNGMIVNLQDLFEPFQAFIRQNHYAMIVTDSQFFITSYNKRAEEMLGYEEKEVIGKKSLLLWHDHDQLHERARFYSDKLKRSVTPDEAVLFVMSHKGFLPDWEWTWINREGTRMLVSLNTSMMRHPDGTIKGYVLIARDISEIKKAVETNTRLLEIMESAHDMIASFDMRGHIFYLNQAGHSFLGIDVLNEDNCCLSHYMTIPMTVRFADGLTEAQKQGYWQGEIQFVGVDGQTQIASITVVAHITDDDTDTFFSTIVRDISDQKEIQRQLVKAKEEADEANEAKSSFLARMSHEIRTPLNGIIGLTYLLQRSELSDIQADYSRQISESSQSLLRILNDILDFSKLEADKLVLERVTFRLDESLHRLSGMFSVLLGTKPIDFIIRIDPDVPDWLVGDPIRLEQVLLNLGSNAIKFTNIGLIDLSIHLIELEGGQARLRFSVMDTGIGMTEQQCSHVFMPFVQADQKTSRKYGGTGLGLVISHTLVERMGGTISVDSTYHVGSTFSFELVFPIDSGKTVPSKLHDLGLHVIVLEDQDYVAEHWRTLLASYGCDVITLRSWAKARPLLQDDKWNLVIVDMESEDMHGEETWMSWKTELDERGIQVISSTSLHGRDALQQLPNEYKPTAVIVKPASTIHVEQALRVICNLAERTHCYKDVPGSPSLLQHGHSLEAPLRILVVDDQEINRIVVKQLLGQQGFEVELSESGNEALIALDNKNFDLILMDLHMPIMDGIEATIHIREHFSKEDLPIIALTADVTKDQEVRCFSAGMNDIIMKPIDPEVFFAVLGRWFPTRLPTLFANIAEHSDAWQEKDLPGLNALLAIQRLDGKTNLYLQLLDKFQQQYSDVENLLPKLLEEDNRAEAIRLVHSLSGTAGHLGASAVQEIASAVERSLKDDGSIEDLQFKLFQSLQETMGTIRNLLLQKRS
ncbi:response regulator [Cohnella luojiensis]|nr:response regulator [Cohnella luojiensis]